MDATLYRNDEYFGSAEFQGSREQWRAFLMHYTDWYDSDCSRLGPDEAPMDFAAWVETNLDAHLVAVEDGEAYPTL